MSNERRKNVTVSGVPLDLLRRIEALAVAEHRDRSGQVVALLEEVVKNRQARDEAANSPEKNAVKGAGAPKAA